MASTDGLDNLRAAVELTKGPHKVSVHIEGDTSNNPAQVRLSWVTPEDRKKNHDAAIDAAKSAKTAVVFAWSRGKTDFVLPGNGEDYDQDKLIEEIAAVNPNTVVVLNVSQPIAMPWLGKVKGVLQMWWPGDEGGWATANILTGKVSPAGRLPFTWAKKLDRLSRRQPQIPRALRKGVDGKTTLLRGRQRRLSLVRQGKNRATISLRLRLELHHLRLRQPQDRACCRRRHRRRI